jgi:hypothetical protein
MAVGPAPAAPPRSGVRAAVPLQPAGDDTLQPFLLAMLIRVLLAAAVVVAFTRGRTRVARDAQLG